MEKELGERGETGARGAEEEALESGGVQGGVAEHRNGGRAEQGAVRRGPYGEAS